MSIKTDINRVVMEALANGVHVIRERDTYRQHCLREHPNVCRQTERHTDTYVLHDEPCGCTADEARKRTEVPTGTCCQMVQPIEAECMFCGEEVA